MNKEKNCMKTGLRLKSGIPPHFFLRSIKLVPIIQPALYFYESYTVYLCRYLRTLSAQVQESWYSLRMKQKLLNSLQMEQSRAGGISSVDQTDIEHHVIIHNTIGPESEPQLEWSRYQKKIEAWPEIKKFLLRNIAQNSTCDRNT